MPISLSTVAMYSQGLSKASETNINASEEQLCDVTRQTNQRWRNSKVPSNSEHGVASTNHVTSSLPDKSNTANQAISIVRTNPATGSRVVYLSMYKAAHDLATNKEEFPRIYRGVGYAVRKGGGNYMGYHWQKQNDSEIQLQPVESRVSSSASMKSVVSRNSMDSSSSFPSMPSLLSLRKSLTTNTAKACQPRMLPQRPLPPVWQPVCGASRPIPFTVTSSCPSTSTQPRGREIAVTRSPSPEMEYTESVISLPSKRVPLYYTAPQDEDDQLDGELSYSEEEEELKSEHDEEEDQWEDVNFYKKMRELTKSLEKKMAPPQEKWIWRAKADSVYSDSRQRSVRSRSHSPCRSPSPSPSVASYPSVAPRSAPVRVASSSCSVASVSSALHAPATKGRPRVPVLAENEETGIKCLFSSISEASHIFQVKDSDEFHRIHSSIANRVRKAGGGAIYGYHWSRCSTALDVEVALDMEANRPAPNSVPNPFFGLDSPTSTPPFYNQISPRPLPPAFHDSTAIAKPVASLSVSVCPEPQLQATQPALPTIASPVGDRKNEKQQDTESPRALLLAESGVSVALPAITVKKKVQEELLARKEEQPALAKAAGQQEKGKNEQGKKEDKRLVVPVLPNLQLQVVATIRSEPQQPHKPDTHLNGAGCVQKCHDRAIAHHNASVALAKNANANAIFAWSEGSSKQKRPRADSRGSQAPNGVNSLSNTTAGYERPAKARKLDHHPNNKNGNKINNSNNKTGGVSVQPHPPGLEIIPEKFHGICDFPKTTSLSVHHLTPKHSPEALRKATAVMKQLLPTVEAETTLLSYSTSTRQASLSRDSTEQSQAAAQVQTDFTAVRQFTRKQEPGKLSQVKEIHAKGKGENSAAVGALLMLSKFCNDL